MKFIKFFSILFVFILLLWYGGDFLSHEIGGVPKLFLYLIILGALIFSTWKLKVKSSKGNLHQTFLFLTVVFSAYLLMASVLILNNTCLTKSDYKEYENQPSDPLVFREPLLTPPPFLCPFSPVGWGW